MAAVATATRPSAQAELQQLNERDELAGNTVLLTVAPAAASPVSL